jgi:nicotinic acid mononucleotide adenylyltransferase
MNPPTVGHEKLVKKVVAVAAQAKATPMVFLSHSQDKKKNPLDYEDKIRFAKAAFGNVIQSSPAKTLIDILKTLQQKFQELTLVVGSDRVAEFETLLNKYNGKDFTFAKINVVSAGERDPDAEGVEGMSASKMRAAVQTGDEQKFISGLPQRLKSHGKDVFKMVSAGMQLHEELEAENLLSEVLTLDQRRKRALIMKRYSGKIERARELSRKRMASTEKLKKRSYIQARDIVRRRVAGRRGAEYATLSPSEKIQIDTQVEKRKGAIKKIASRLMPKVKAAEYARLKSFTQGAPMQHMHSGPAVQHEQFNEAFEEFAKTVEIVTVDDILQEMTDLVLEKIITEKQIQALEKRALRSGIEYDLLEQVYVRGLLDSMGDQHAAFNRVNAFCCGGKTAMNEDFDLYEQIERKDLNDVFEGLKDPKDNPCWDNYKPVGTKKKAGKVVPNCVPEAVEKVTGTNCKNCVWWCEDDERKVGKDELNENGGIKPYSDNYKKMAKEVDLVTLPGKGTATIKTICEHKKVMDWVTERMCCALWDGEGTKREYEGDATFMEQEATSKGTEARKKIEKVDRKAPHTEHGKQAEIQTKIIDEEGNCESDPKKREQGTKSLVKAYKKDTPGEGLNESFNIAYAAGIGITLTAADMGMKARGGFALHPSVVQQMEDEELEEAAKTADKAPVVVPSHTDAYGNVIPAKTVMRRKSKSIVNTGDNPSDGQ